MAEAAFDLVVISWWQFGAGAFGISLLMVTLWYTRKSTKAAIGAVKAAEGAVKITSDTAERQLRAYLNIHKAYVIWEKNRVVRAWVDVTNTGQTPARDIEHWISLNFGDDVQFPAPPLDTMFPDQSKSDLGAGIHLTVDIKTDPLTDENWRDIRARSMNLYVWGEIRYLDIFKRETRYTRFRFVLGEDGDDLSTLPEGNEAT